MADMSPMPRRYEPGHPDADSAGYVTYPECESGDGDGRFVERGAGLPAECGGGAGGEEHDPAVAADFDLGCAARDDDSAGAHLEFKKQLRKENNNRRSDHCEI